VVDLEVYAYHGVFEEEKKTGQKFLVSFQVFLDLTSSSQEDELSLSVSYADLCESVIKSLTDATYDLIETAAEHIVKDLLLTNNKIRKVKVTLKKPEAPMGRKLKYPLVQIERSWHTVYIGMGSNLGDSRETIKQAGQIISKDLGIRLKRLSTLIETEPWGKKEQPNFINTVCEIETWWTPEQLMHFLLEVEEQFGRKRKEQWGPRTLDLDILLYDQLMSENPYVILPHPWLHKRLFILDALCELNPYLIHPLLGKRMMTLKEDLLNDLRSEDEK